MFSDQSLENLALKDVIEKNAKARRAAGTGGLHMVTTHEMSSAELLGHLPSHNIYRYQGNWISPRTCQLSRLCWPAVKSGTRCYGFRKLFLILRREDHRFIFGFSHPNRKRLIGLLQYYWLGFNPNWAMVWTMVVETRIPSRED